MSPSGARGDVGRTSNCRGCTPTTEEAARLGEAIHERDIRAQVEVDRDGEYVAIDIKSGCWAVAEDLLAAANDLRSRPPGVLDVWRVRVGHRALRHFGGRPLRRTE